jgi:ornithine cyclodeaminase
MVKLYASKSNKRNYKLGIIGAGLINRYVLKFIKSSGIDIVGVRVFDLNNEYSEKTVTRLREMGMQDVEIAQDMAEVIKYGEIISFATTAPTPHVLDPELFAHTPLVLHLSLRDLGPEVILSSANIVDDIDHALKAKTSLHLTEIKTGNRDFVSSTIAELLLEEKTLPTSQTIIYSPFGMGILDLAIGKFVVDEVESNAVHIDNFFHDLVRI